LGLIINECHYCLLLALKLLIMLYDKK